MLDKIAIAQLLYTAGEAVFRLFGQLIDDSLVGHTVARTARSLLNRGEKIIAEALSTRGAGVE